MFESPLFPQDASIAAKYTEVVWLFSPTFFEAPFLLTYTVALLCNSIHSVVSFDNARADDEQLKLAQKETKLPSKELTKQGPVAKARKKSLGAEAKNQSRIQNKS